MAWKLKWSYRARNDRKEILEYWIKRNKSNSYSKKLNQLFKESAQLISNLPQIGRPSNLENVRVKIIKDYLMIYEISNEEIIILTIWDTRRNPEKLDIK